MSTVYLRGGQQREPRTQSSTLKGKRKQIPLEDLTVPLIVTYVDDLSTIHTVVANSVPDKLELLNWLLDEIAPKAWNFEVLTTWPGQTRQDVFVMDRLDVAIEYLKKEYVTGLAKGIYR
jgi:hypothetical protein